MATAGMQNMNVPATKPGPLTSEELDACRRGNLRRPYIAAGLDQQGRNPEAAHAASEIVDDLAPPTGVIVSLSIVGGIVSAVLALHWWLS